MSYQASHGAGAPLPEGAAFNTSLLAYRNEEADNHVGFVDGVLRFGKVLFKR